MLANEEIIAVERPTRPCRVCGAAPLAAYTRKNGFHLGRCPSCRLVQVSDDVSDVDFEEVYGQEFFDDTYDWLREDKGRRKEYAKFNYRLEQIEKHVPGKGTILDVGCSFGFFLDVARSRGWEPVGVEVGEYAAEFGRRELGLDIHTSDIHGAPLAQGRFAAATLWNVIEHIDDPVREFRRLNALLEIGGLVVFTTGDQGSYIARLRGTRWRRFIPPIHLTNFNLKAVDVMLERTGFRVVESTVALPRETLLRKLHVLDLLKKIRFSDKMMIFARKERHLVSDPQ